MSDPGDLNGRHRISWVILAIFITVGSAYIFVTSKYMTVTKPQYRGKPTCTVEMYEGDLNAYWSCRTLDALQNNWFPSPIAGLFTYQAWNGFDGFWQNGIVLEALANFMEYTNSSRYSKTLVASFRSLTELTNAYAPVPSCDDELWYGLAYMRIYEVTRKKKFLNMAQQIFDWTWQTCWDFDLTCHGGMFFDTSRNYKSTITNVEALKLGPLLYIYTKKQQYLERSYEVLNYIFKNKIIDMDTFVVHDSINSNSCETSGLTTFTYECGMAIGAMVSMYKATRNETYLRLANQIASANIWGLSLQGVLVEHCDPDSNCASSKDARAFKGIFVRNLRYLMDYSSPDETYLYRTWLHHNVNSLLHNAMCDITHNKTTNTTTHCDIQFQDGRPLNTPIGPVFNENWKGPFQYSTPIEQTSALELLISSIDLDTQCVGRFCNFDPDIPNMDKLTCDDNPCPVSHKCCSWDQRYHTCCTPDQKCTNGGCY